MLSVVRCGIWYHSYNLKNVKKTHGGVLLSVKLQAKSAHHILVFLSDLPIPATVRNGQLVL